MAVLNNRRVIMGWKPMGFDLEEATSDLDDIGFDILTFHVIPQ